MKTRFTLFSLLLCGMPFCYSQSQPVSTSIPWTKEDSAAINALALYPDTTRLKIYRACQYPAIIVNAASLQKNSSAAFASLISGFPRSMQEDLWNLSRYPNLISSLADGGKKSTSQTDSILAAFPPEIHDAALKYAQNNYGILKSINDLQDSVDGQFRQLLASYPADIQALFEDLIRMPALFSLLNDNLNLTVRVGDHYKRNPEGLTREMDSVATVRQQQQAKDVEDWKNTLQNDSSARKDLQQAANEYADSNGYKTADVDTPHDTTIINNYYTYPYPYWFGYPVWYPYDYWYPYPYWYDWGFYYGPYGNMVVFGMPSYYFLNWYFWRPLYWGRYPYLGSCFINHYYGRHRLHTLDRLVVHNWVQENRRYLPANFTGHYPHRAEAMRQIARLNARSLNKDGSINERARSQYFTSNRASFTALNRNPSAPVIPEERQISNVRQPFNRQPAVNPSRVISRQRIHQPPANQPAKGGNVRQGSVSPGRQPSPKAPRSNYGNIQRANSYHSAGWARPSYAPVKAGGTGGVRSQGGLRQPGTGGVRK